MGHLALIRFYSCCPFAFFSFQVIAEGANGPTTPAAEKVLIENKTLVIPVSFIKISLEMTNLPPFFQCKAYIIQVLHPEKINLKFRMVL